MTINEMRNDLLNRYNRRAYCHKYIMGFIYKKVVYFAHCDERDLDRLVTVGECSRGGYSIRFRPDNEMKASLLDRAEVLCSASEFSAICEASKYNKGEVFEQMVTEHFGQIWTKDSVPFWKGPDITVDGINYQIKFQEASFISESALARIGA